MDRNALKERYEDRLSQASRQIRQLERETREAGADVPAEMTRALEDLTKQRDELSQTIDRFEADTNYAVDDLTEAVDTALGNLEERLRRIGSNKR